MKVLILGVSGMLGHALFKTFLENPSLDLRGAARSTGVRDFFPAKAAERITCGFDAENPDALLRLLAAERPQVVVNCIGVIKQLPSAREPLITLPVNAVFPHRLARACEACGARLIHIGTDCVFNGRQGGYTESDPCSADDLYGLSKFLGEVDYPHAVTLRTSIIGHELQSCFGLLEWFLHQQGAVKGFRKAIFSGLPTVELARVIRDRVLPAPELSGLYHVAAAPISKFDLLRLIAEVYGKTIDIAPDDTLSVDRSLNADKFRAATGYTAPPWPELIRAMREFGR
jgi:dTDP-4-dehydrorhamnose reductase